MADSTIVISTELDNKQAEKELQALTTKIKNMSEKLRELESEKFPLVEQSRQLGANLDAAKATLEHMKSGEEFFTSDSIANQQDQVNAIQKEFDSVDSKVQSIDGKIKNMGDKIYYAKTQASGLSAHIAGAGEKTRKLSPAAEKASKRFENLGNRIKGLAKRVFAFTLITAALRKIREYMWAAIQTNTDAMAALAKLKGALRTLAQPIVNVVIPAFTLFANVLTVVVNTAARLLSALFGSTLASSQKAAKSLYDQQNAIKGVGSAAKKASKNLASFDELNTMSGDSDSSGGGGVSSGVAPDFASMVSSGLTAVATLFTGVALLALGAVIAFSGMNIPLGITMMVAGALAVYGAASENWELIAATLQGSLAAVMAVIAGAVLAIGVILVMGGHIPIGIGMILAGAAALATVAAVNWDTITKFITDNINIITSIVGAASLAVGAILALSGANLPLGIALLLVGAGSLAASITLNWDTIQNAMKGPIGETTAIISGAVLVLGATLLFTGAGIPLGIGLILLGSAGLATAIVPNWNTVQEKLQGPLGGIMALIGGFLVVLGLILLFTGAGIPLGIGLIVAGGASLAAAIAPNWNFITEKVKGVWQSVKDFWNAKIAPIFTAAWWANLGKTIMNGLISGVEAGINWVLGGIGDMANGITGILNKIPGVNIGRVNWGNVHIPRLAQGAVIPANREFLAVLGDQKHGANIEAPADLIRQIVREEVGQTSGATHVTIVLDSVDGKKLFDAIVKQNNAVIRATGASPLVV